MEDSLLQQEQILTLLQEDRERGAQLLLETYTPLLWSVCQRRLSDPEDIKECINDVFTGFCMNADRFDPEQSSLKNYLAMLADRKAISYYRSNQRRSQAEWAAADPEDPDRAGLHQDLEEALSLLQPEDEQIIRMKYYGGLTYREIAGQMGLAEEAVKKRGRRSLRKLAKWLLIGLVMAALLAGCTYVAHRYFRYFRGVGVIPDENFPVYQMLDAPEPISVNGVTVHPLNVSYSDETLALTLAFLPDGTNGAANYELNQCLADGYNYSVNGSPAESPSYHMDVMFQHQTTIPRESLTADADGRIRLRLDLIPQQYNADQLRERFDFDMDMSVLSWDITLEETEAIQDLTELGCYLETTYADFLVLTDWEVSGETGETYTLISLCPIYKTEGLALSDLISTCYFPLEGRAQEYPTLIGADGTEYPVYRTVRPSPATDSNEFTLWFKDLPAGEYTLRFPGFCYRAAEDPAVLTLALPDADGVALPCDQTLTMADGSTLSISGITRQSVRDHGIFMTEYWTDGVQTWVPEEDDITLWHYAADYTLNTGDTLPLWGISFSDKFCYDTEDGIIPIVTTSGMYHNPGTLEQLSFGARDALGMDAPDLVRLTLYDSYYADPNPYSVSFTVK